MKENEKCFKLSRKLLIPGIIGIAVMLFSIPLISLSYHENEGFWLILQLADALALGSCIFLIPLSETYVDILRLRVGKDYNTKERLSECNWESIQEIYKSCRLSNTIFIVQVCCAIILLVIRLIWFEMNIVTLILIAICFIYIFCITMIKLHFSNLKAKVDALECKEEKQRIHNIYCELNPKASEIMRKIKKDISNNFEVDLTPYFENCLDMKEVEKMILDIPEMSNLVTDEEKNKYLNSVRNTFCKWIVSHSEIEYDFVSKKAEGFPIKIRVVIKDE